MGIWESALILLGIGIVSSKFGAGTGLGELGKGVESLAGAPLRGVGGGLFEFSTGLRSFAEALGDIGRGFAELFKSVPGGPPLPSPNGDELYTSNGNGLVPDSGGDSTTYMTGGGGNVPNGRILTVGSDIGPLTGTYADIWGVFAARGFQPTQISALLNPIWGFDPNVSMPPGTPGGYNV